MAKSDFLIRLIKERNIENVEPSDEVSKAYLEKARRYIETSNILFNYERFEESVSISYYSMYYSVLSLLFKVGIKSENHTASIILLKDVFNIDNSKISFAKSQRIDKQYYIDFNITKEDSKQLIEISQTFNAELESAILKIKECDIQRYKKIFEGWLIKHANMKNS